MLFMGVFLGLIHKAKEVFGVGIYAFILTHTIIWIETGPTDIMIWFLYLIGIVYLKNARIPRLLKSRMNRSWVY